MEGLDYFIIGGDDILKLFFLVETLCCGYSFKSSLGDNSIPMSTPTYS